MHLYKHQRCISYQIEISICYMLKFDFNMTVFYQLHDTTYLRRHPFLRGHFSDRQQEPGLWRPLFCPGSTSLAFCKPVLGHCCNPFQSPLYHDPSLLSLIFGRVVSSHSPFPNSSATQFVLRQLTTRDCDL